MSSQGGVESRAVAFDPAAEKVYAQNSRTPLLLFSMTGLKEREMNFRLPSGETPALVKELAAHPAGGKVLIRTKAAVIGVELEGG